MNANEAGRITRLLLNELGVSFSRVSARTVSFQDLARADAIAVKVTGWYAGNSPNPAAFDAAKTALRAQGILLSVLS